MDLKILCEAMQRSEADCEIFGEAAEDAKVMYELVLAQMHSDLRNIEEMVDSNLKDNRYRRKVMILRRWESDAKSRQLEAEVASLKLQGDSHTATNVKMRLDRSFVYLELAIVCQI